MSLEGPEGFLGGLAFGELAVVVGAAVAVAVPDLGDRGHVDGVVQAAVPAPGQPGLVADYDQPRPEPGSDIQRCPRLQKITID
jgi:hypothetical protein